MRCPTDATSPHTRKSSRQSVNCPRCAFAWEDSLFPAHRSDLSSQCASAFTHALCVITCRGSFSSMRVAHSKPIAVHIRCSNKNLAAAACLRLCPAKPLASVPVELFPCPHAAFDSATRRRPLHAHTKSQHARLRLESPRIFKARCASVDAARSCRANAHTSVKPPQHHTRRVPTHPKIYRVV